MAGYRPGPEVRRDPYDSGDQPRDPNRPRRTLGPYGPREETGPGDDPYAGPSYDPPGYGRPAYGGSRPAGYAAAPPWERQPGPAGAPSWGQQDGPPGGPPRRQQARRPARPDPTGGAEGNERLTAATGAVLLVMFAAEGFTILAIHQMITLHFFLGMLLIGPVMLKAATVCYRFARYYAGAPEYRRKGPPAPLLRLLGPFVLFFSLGVIGTGVMLGVTGSVQPWLFLHKAFFVLWFGVMTIHVLAYVWRLPALIGSDLRSSPRLRRTQEIVGGRRARWLLLAASLIGGLIIALMTVHLASPWTGFRHFG